MACNVQLLSVPSGIKLTLLGRMQGLPQIAQPFEPDLPTQEPFLLALERRFSYEVFPNILPLLFILCQDVIKLSLANQS